MKPLRPVPSREIKISLARECNALMYPGKTIWYGGTRLGSEVFVDVDKLEMLMFIFKFVML
jgi:hypothetical protein